MRKVHAKMVPKNLMTEQKANWRDVCLDLFEREPKFFSRVITGDESWILECDPETKRQIWEWHTAKSPHPKKARISKCKIKSILVCFFWQSGDRLQGICATRTNCQLNILSGSPWKTEEMGGMCVTRHCTHTDAAPRQHPMSHGVSINKFLAEKSIPVVPQPPLFARSQPLWLLFIPPAQKPLERVPFWYSE